MIKVIHILPYMMYGGIEQLVLNLCRFSRSTEFMILSLRRGKMKGEFKKEGIPIFILEDIKNKYDGYRKAIEILKKADLIHMHWRDPDPRQLWLAQQTKVPYAITLHWPSRLPLLDCMISTGSESAKSIQDERNRCIVIRNGVNLTKFVYKPKRRNKNDKIIITLICRPDKCAPYFWYAMKEVL